MHKLLITVVIICGVANLIGGAIWIMGPPQNCHRHMSKIFCGDDDKAYHIVLNDILRSIDEDGVTAQT